MIQSAETACPQCGALLTVPHQVDTFACAHCGSSLRAGQGLRVHRLVERPRVSRMAAAGFLKRWFAGSDGPADLEKAALSNVDGLRYFPFLRIRRTGADTVRPLAPLPGPEVLGLARVPAELETHSPEAGGAGGAGGAIDPVPGADDLSLPGEPPPEWTAIDGDLFREELRHAAADPEAREILVEQRAYYPARYEYQGERFWAVIDAGAGRVFTERRPARKEVLGERRVALGTLALLFAEAVLLPGLGVRLVVIAVTAGGLYPLLRWAAERHG